MTKSELFLEGLNLMFAGMGFVVGFLILLIFALNAMSWAINRFFPELLAVPASASLSAPPVNEPANEDERLRKAIIAAVTVHHHRQSR